MLQKNKLLKNQFHIPERHQTYTICKKKREIDSALEHVKHF